MENNQMDSDVPFPSSAAKEKESKSAYMLRWANVLDIETIVKLDERAKTASTGTGFDESQRLRRRNDILRMIDDEKYKVMMIDEIVGLKAEGVGFLLVHGAPEPIRTQGITKGMMVDSENSEDQAISEADFVSMATDLVGKTKRAHLVSIAIDEGHSGKGIGSRAMLMLEEKLKGEGFGVLSLDTGVNNLAMRKASKGFTFFQVESGSGYEGDRLVAMKLL